MDSLENGKAARGCAGDESILEGFFNQYFNSVRLNTCTVKEIELNGENKKFSGCSCNTDFCNQALIAAVKCYNNTGSASATTIGTGVECIGTNYCWSLGRDETTLRGCGGDKSISGKYFDKHFKYISGLDTCIETQVWGTGEKPLNIYGCSCSTDLCNKWANSKPIINTFLKSIDKFTALFRVGSNSNKSSNSNKRSNHNSCGKCSANNILSSLSLSSLITLCVKVISQPKLSFIL